MKIKKLIQTVLSLLLIIISLGTNLEVYASEDNSPESVDAENIKVPVEINDNKIISVILPVVEGIDPFSFFIDPKNILFNSFKNSEDVYVEEGANLLFINRSDNAYGLSSQSDKLSIINQSTVPVEATITAKLDNIDEITLEESLVLPDGNNCSVYLALVDDRGNEVPLSENGEASLTILLEKAPIDAYAFEYDEETDEYSYAYLINDNMFDSFSFGLKGVCNKDGNWSELSEKPAITLSWTVEPIIDEEISVDSNDIDNESGNTPDESGVLPDSTAPASEEEINISDVQTQGDVINPVATPESNITPTSESTESALNESEVNTTEENENIDTENDDTTNNQQ